MFSRMEDVEAQALSKRGWSISAVARHLERDRKTVRSYLRGDRSPGARRPAGPDPLAPLTPYLRARLADDPHVWASALFDEVVPLGYGGSERPRWPTVGELADAEVLMALPAAPYPATVEVARSSTIRVGLRL